MQQERDLILKLNKGDKESFNLLFERYYPLFISFTRRMLRNDSVCQDIVQNVFMRMWIHREHLDPDRPLKNYLLVSVRNEIYCHLRLVFNSRRDDMTDDFCELPDMAATPSESYSAKDFQARVDEIVSNMPERRREVFELSRRKHLSNAEIAEKLNISVRTVEKHLQLALSDIRRILRLSVALIVTLLW
ncbi:MAG: RNA polymerase sigma-70 factor [Bacteroidales bacterium]|nr:RNA polymerase sigma-70 factor [Bacteroidales bacterium]